MIQATMIADHRTAAATVDMTTMVSVSLAMDMI